MKSQHVWILATLAFFDIGTVVSEAFSNPSQKAILNDGRFQSQCTEKAFISTSKGSRNPHGMVRTKIVSFSGGASSAPSPPTTLIQEMMAELIGTFLIVQIGTGSVMSAVFTGSIVGVFQIACVWIMAVTIAICATASISGAHLNPAVSIAFALLRPSKSFGWKKVIPYSFAQLVGAVLASFVNLLLYGSTIIAFESANGIVRGSLSGLASAKAFGEYFA